MKALTFDEDKRVIIKLPILTQNDKQGSTDLSARGEARRNKGEVELAFFEEEFEYTTHPSTEQLYALQYIRSNQEKLLKTFFQYTKEVLYPVHIEFIGFDEVSFPTIKKVTDLRKSLGISEIYFFQEHKDGVAYVAYSFDFTGDFEHGVVLIAHKDEILGWEEDVVNDKVIADLSE